MTTSTLGCTPAPAGSCSKTPSPTTWWQRSAPSPPVTPSSRQPQQPGDQRAVQIRRALTPREQDVFALIAAGLSNGEIAARMHLSAGTVKVHVGRILAKLGLR